MTEFFLHHLWKLKLFDSTNLVTTENEAIEIIKTGQHNTDSGPDFFNAQVKIDNTLWAGNVEIHLRSSDWNNHSHEKDEAYNNVILHVVYKNDEQVKRKDGSLIPALELKGRFDDRLWKNYADLLQSRQWIPCEKRIAEVDSLTIDNWLDRLLAERLENKTERILSSLQGNGNNWEETFYQHLAKNFGFRINADPFERIATTLPVSLLAKHRNHRNQLEALLFGQAGMLELKMTDAYPNELKKEYSFLRNKFNLIPIPLHQWKFLRLRPVNFPTIRLAQFAQLIHQSTHLFSRILECDNFAELKKYFHADVSSYWQTHYVFDKISTEQPKHIGDDAIQNIAINTIVPFLFAYGRNRNAVQFEERAFSLLEEIPAEKNSIIDGWKNLGIEPASAYRSQALLQLKNEYCVEKKCLTCSVGNKIISKLQ